jgi:uncharacterized membrane protein HdeD (DUF308 family)
MADQEVDATQPLEATATGTGAPPGDAGAGAGMTGRAMGAVMQNAPWRRGIGWQMIGAEGLIAAGVGIYMVADPDGAADVVRQLLGALLLVDSVLRVLQGIRENPQGLPGTPYRLVTGGIGLAVGVIVLVEGFSDYLTADAARWVLAFGFLAFGLIGLAAEFATRETGGLRRGPLITGVVSTVFAVLLFYNLRHDSLDASVFGWAFIVLDVVLVAFAYLLYKREQAGDAAGAATAV